MWNKNILKWQSWIRLWWKYSYFGESIPPADIKYLWPTTDPIPKPVWSAVHWEVQKILLKTSCCLQCWLKVTIIHTHGHTHLFNGPFSGTTRVSRYQKGKTNLDFTEARDSEWQWHQLGHMQVCTSLQTDNHASTHHSVFYRPDALPATQPTASKHWRDKVTIILIFLPDSTSFRI